MTTLDEQLRAAAPTTVPAVDHAALQRRGRRRRRGGQFATGIVAVVVLGGGVGLAAQLARSPQPSVPVDVLGVDTGEHPACEVVDGVYATPEACAGSITDDVMSQIRANGSAFERQILADKEVTASEYDEAAARAAACMNEILTETLPGATAQAVLHSTSIGQQYGFEYVISDDDQAILPGQVGNAQEAVNDARCSARLFDRIHLVWTAQLIAAQGA